jgi:Na+/H+-dicarboxylate symporter
MIRKYWWVFAGLGIGFTSHTIVEAIDSPTVTYYHDLIQLVVLPIVALVLFIIAEIGEQIIEKRARGQKGEEQ